MFEPGDKALHARIEQLEGQVSQLTGALGTLLGDRGQHPQPRSQVELDTVYQAKTLGYVSVYFITGRIARMRLMVGTTNPPTECVGRASDGYMGAIVRPGEFWMVAPHQHGIRSGHECFFTPLC